MSPFTPSLRLHDRYVLHERIGLGGMSEVWRADDEVLGRSVAVKILAGTSAVDPQLRATIRREARAAARLAHPHVTQVYDYGEAALAGGTVVPYLVMELVDGQNLADRLADGPLAWRPAFRMAAEVAAALAAAHRLDVVHRDIKPGNVMLTDSGAKVLDFGIAAPVGSPPAGSGPPAGGPMMGTPAYLAPERLSADAPNPAGDVYALGALLYRTLTGAVPLPVRSWEDAVVVHASRPAVPRPRVPGLPADLAGLVLACLDPDPARRPTAGQLAARFRAVAGPVASGSDLPTTGTAASGTGHDADAATRALPDHPPTLVEGVAGWPAAAFTGGPRPVPAAPPRGPAGAGPIPGRRPAPFRGPARSGSTPRRRSGRPRRAGPPAGALIAAGLALLVGLGAALALGDQGGGQPAAAPTTASATPPAATKPTPTPDATPSAVRPQPVSLRQTATELIAMLAAAQLTGEIDGKTADRLRKELTDLAGSRPKDHEKRLDDLRDRLDDEVERGRLPADFAGRLDDLLDRLEVTPAGRDG
ncbi:serine/threonine protein kinase [Micromonospora sp. Llam7]|uniref:serine/threonine-protein kinase n=1 Tax=Micromonospora tarapacensis TaxID=2835305 RepID=UPI001C82AE0E|nr:serine/threonine-protein kinase [Micromonospora tarapacensis]MBX7267135.1 serine/threonine protein kinase [Micromonospora tarapacensis]